VRTTLDEWRPSSRPAGTWASRVTSIDVKLAYDRTADRFVAFALSDCNANPEGIPFVHDRFVRPDLTVLSARSYLGPRSGDIAVWLPSEVWNEDDGWLAPDSWLTRDRRALFEAFDGLDRDCTPYRASSRQSIRVDGSELVYTGPDADGSVRLDGYVNLDDTGTGLCACLGADVSRFARGTNSPSGVWTPALRPTGKPGLSRSLADLSEQYRRVLVPESARVETVSELTDFRKRCGSPVVLKDPFGTWGTGVVEIRPGQDPVEPIRAKERAVREHRGWSDFRLLRSDDERLEFTSRGTRVEYGQAAEAITGHVAHDGHRYDVVAVPADVHPLSRTSPVDFVSLVLAGPAGQLRTPSTAVRVSSKPALNGNPRFRFIEDGSLERVMTEELNVPLPGNGSFAFHLGEHLADLADRPVDVSEIRPALRDAAELALAARNLSAFRAEGTLTADAAKKIYSSKCQ